MALALSKQVSKFELVLQKHYFQVNKREQIKDWYGLNELPKTTFINRVSLTFFKKIYDFVYDPIFNKKICAYLKERNSKTIVYTRCESLALECVNKGIRTVLEYHNDKENPYFKHVVSASQKPSFLMLVTIHKSLKQQYVSAGIASSKIVIFEDAVDVNRYTNPVKPPYSLLKKHPPTIDVLYTGSLYDYKNVELLIEAAKLLPHLNFIIQGGKKEQVEAYRNKESNLSNVFFFSHIPNKFIPFLQKQARILVLTHQDECRQSKYTSPIKLYEYLAAKRPILAPDIKAFEGVISHNVHALLYDANNVESLVKNINKITDNLNLAKHLCEHAFNLAQENTWHKRAALICNQISLRS